MMKSTTSKQNYNHEDQLFHVQQHQPIQSQQHTSEQFVQHDDRYYDHNTNSSTLLQINDDTDLQQQQPQDLRDAVDYVDQELLESFAESLSSMDYTTLCIMNHKSREDNNNNNNNDATIINNNNNNDNIYMNRNQSQLSSSNSVSMNDLHLLSTQDLLDSSIDNFPLLFPGITIDR